MKTFRQIIQLQQSVRKKVYGTILISVFLISIVLVAQSSPSPIYLGSVEDFVVLTKTGITNSGTTDITGTHGISYAATTSITGFDLILDPSGTFSTSLLEAGKIYTSYYTDPLPAKLTAAVRTVTDYTELHSGDLTAQTLTSGLYKWDNGVMVMLSSVGVTISGTSKDIMIFQFAQVLVLSKGANVYLSGCDKATSIFWQVAEQITLGTTSVMNGVVYCQTHRAMNTDAPLKSRSFTQKAAKFDANYLTDPVITSENDDKFITAFLVEENYPKPFNPFTEIQYSIEKTFNVTLRLFSILGNVAATHENKHQEAGSYSIPFKTNDLAYEISSGICFYRLQAESSVSKKKLILVK